jgi:hypothetical protein
MSNRRQVILALCTARTSWPAESVSAILDGITGRYSGMQRYSISVRTWDESKVDVRPKPITNQYKLMYFDAGHFLYEVGKGTGTRIAIVADGKSYWYYLEHLNECTRETIMPGSMPDAVKSFSQMNSFLFTRFRRVNALASSAKLLGTCKADGSKKEMLLLELLPSQEPWREALWVDPDNFLVQQSGFERDRSGTTRQVRRCTYHSAPESVEDFQFEPPSKAKLVQRFSRTSSQ